MANNPIIIDGTLGLIEMTDSESRVFARSFGVDSDTVSSVADSRIAATIAVVDNTTVADSDAAVGYFGDSDNAEVDFIFVTE